MRDFKTLHAEMRKAQKILSHRTAGEPGGNYAGWSWRLAVCKAYKKVGFPWGKLPANYNDWWMHHGYGKCPPMSRAERAAAIARHNKQAAVVD